MIKALKRIIQEARALLRSGKVGKPCPDHGLSQPCGICNSIATEYKNSHNEGSVWGRDMGD